MRRQLCALAATVMVGALPAVAGVASAADEPSLVVAARDQQWALVDQLLTAGADPAQTQPDGATALHWAAFHDAVDPLTTLLEAGADPDVRNEYGATPLWVACSTRSSGAVDRLLAVGADANLGLRAGETVLMRCVHTGDVEAVEALVGAGAEVDAREPGQGQTALMWAAAHRRPEITRVLLAHGADVDARSKTRRQHRGTGFRSTTSPAGSDYFDAGGFTALLFAARHGDVKSADLLLDAGAAIDEPGADGNTPMVLAAMSGHPRLAERLLKRGANPDAAGAGYTALHAAVLRPEPDLARALLAAGADPDPRMERGTPVPRWTYQLVFTLREKGATPLLLAAAYLEPELVRLLASAGADPSARFDDERTALMAAAGMGASRSTNRRRQLIAPELVAAEWQNEPRVLDTVMAVLEATGTDAVTEANRSGDTALHSAARFGYRSVADYLVAQGADLDAGNYEGQTPRQYLDR